MRKEGASKRARSGLEKLWKSDFLRKVAAISLNRGFVMGMGFLISVVLVRALGPEGRGLYVSAMSVAWIGIQLGNLGLHVPNTLLVARDRRSVARLTANSLVAGALIGGGGALAAGLCFILFPSWAPVQGWLLWMSLLWIPFGVIYYLFYNLLIGIQKVGAFVKIDSASKGIQFLVVCLLAVLFPARVEIFFGCGLALLVVGCAWQLWELRRHFQEPLRPAFDLYKGIFFHGFKAYGVALFAFLLVRIDVLIVKYLKGPEQTGYYSVAASLADIIPIVPSMIGVILFPKLSALTDSAERWKLVRGAIWITGLSLLPFMLLAFFLAGPAIELFYGAGFLPAARAFQLLVPGIYFLALQMVAIQFLKSEKIPMGILATWAGTVALNILLDLWLVPQYGIEGASVVSSACYFLIFLLNLGIIWSKAPVLEREARSSRVVERKWPSSLLGHQDD